MADILIRGLSSAAVQRIDEEAAAQGLSRNELLRRRLEQTPAAGRPARVTLADLQRAAEASGDLLDEDLMNAAWR